MKSLWLLCLSLFLSKALFSSSAPSPASWVANSIPSDSGFSQELQNIVAQVSQNIGAPAADAISLIAVGALAPQPYLTYDWLNDFATALSSGNLPYTGMTALNLADMFDKSSAEYGYIINHFVPALQEMGSSLVGSADSLIGTLSNIVITTINNNTQMSFDIYQGSNSANVGASNINLQPSFSGQANSNSPGFKIGSLKPGVNSVALYGAAQGQGDILFVPNDGSGSVPSSGTTTGSFRIHFMPPAESSLSAYLCVQILPIDFPSSQGQEAQNMLQRTQCIDASQANGVLNITLQIEDNMTSWAPAVPATATAAAVPAIAPSKIDQSSVPMYYPSICSLVSIPEQNVPFIELPKHIAANAILSSWVDFINIVNGAFSGGQVLTPSQISGIMARQPLAFLLKENGNQFGDISKILMPEFKGSRSNYSLPSTQINGQIFPRNVGYMVAGLVGTQYLFTGDIPNLDEFHLYLKLNSSLDVAQAGRIVSLEKSATVSNLWSSLEAASPASFFMPVTPQFVGLTPDGAQYTLIGAQRIAKQLFGDWSSSSLLFCFLSSSVKVFSLQDSDMNMQVSFIVKDVFAYLQRSIASGLKSRPFLMAANGLRSFVINSSMSVMKISENKYLFRAKISDQVFKALQKNPSAIKALLHDTQVVKLPYGKNLYANFNFAEVLKLLFAQRGLALSDDGTLREAPPVSDASLVLNAVPGKKTTPKK